MSPDCNRMLQEHRATGISVLGKQAALELSLSCEDRRHWCLGGS